MTRFSTFNVALSNPILQRELRVRWRGWRGFVLLFGASSLLVLGMTLLYASNFSRFGEGARQSVYITNNMTRVWSVYPTGRINTSDHTAPLSSIERATEMAHAGRDMFIALTVGQTLLWLLIAPALAATGMAGEREAGLLESLQMSFLGSRSIVYGKLFSTLSLGALLLLLPLPTIAVCFMMGGVAPAEFEGAFVLQASVFFCAASSGLFFGARSRTALSALFLSYTSMIVWGSGAYVLVWLLSNLFPLWNPTAHLLTGEGWTLRGSDLLGGLNPVLTTLSASGEAQLSFGSVQSVSMAWACGLIFQAGLSLMLIRGAKYWVVQTLPERPSRERGRGWVDKWREQLETRVAQERTRAEAQVAQSSTSERVERALLSELPMGRLLNFRNPVLQREVRAKFRLRVPRKGILRILWGVGAICVLSGYVWTIFSSLDAMLAQTMFPILARLAFLACLFIPALLTAPAFARERETETWEALRLTTLPAGEVLRGKLLAPLIACVYWSLPAWPPLLFAGWRAGGSVILLIATMLAGAALFSASWGLGVSWRCRRTVTAVCWTLGTLACWTFGGSYFGEIVGQPLIRLLQNYGYAAAPYGGNPYYNPYYGYSNGYEDSAALYAQHLLCAVHLPATFFSILSGFRYTNYYGYNPYPSAYTTENTWFLCLILTALASGFLLLLVWNAMRRARDTDPTHRPFWPRRNTKKATA